MDLDFRRISIGTALFVAAVVVLTSVGFSFAAPKSAPPRAQSSAAQIMGVLTTQGNKPISINGASVKTGGSVPSGALIQTPDGVGATVRIPGLGSVCIGAGSTLNIQFDSASGITITLAQGCAILRTSTGTAGRINTTQGTAGQIDPASGGSIDVCASSSGVTIGQGAAAASGAGASALDCGAPAGAAAAPGVHTSTKVAILGGITAAALTPLLFRGGNPSPFVP